MFHPDGPSLRELAEQAWSSTTGGYDLLAPKFDFTPFRTPDWVLEPVAERLGREGVRRALDACCGTGAALGHVRAHATDSVVGIDLSQGMLDQARINLDQADGVPFELVQGDFLEAPFDGGFDLVTCFGAFGHILRQDEPRFVDAIWRALDPGGRFAFVTSDAPDNRSWRVWAARGFNAAIHVRNAVKDPPFHMYYLSFRLPRATELLEHRGFRVQVERDLFTGKYSGCLLVRAYKPDA